MDCADVGGNPVRFLAKLVVSAIVAAALVSGCSAWAQDKPRELLGTVTDQRHEPLRGAVVEVQDDKTLQVVSFLTDKSGHYDFKRLMGGEDYHFWATYRSHRSRKRHLGMFDSGTVTKVNLAVRLQ